MVDIADGEVVSEQGSGKEPCELKNVGGVCSCSCSCPAWRNAGGAIDRRTCKHLKAHRGAEIEAARLGSTVLATSATKVKATKPKKPAGEAGGDDVAAAEGTVAEGTAPPVLLAYKWTVRRRPVDAPGSPGSPTDRRCDSAASALADGLRRFANQLEAGLLPV